MATAPNPARRAAVPLIDFFETQFLTDTPAADNRHDRPKYRRACRELSRVLEREATTDDLHKHAIARFRAHLAAAGMSRNTCDRLYQAVTRMWRVACARKLVDAYDPPHNFPRKSLPLPTFHRRQAQRDNRTDPMAPPTRPGNPNGHSWPPAVPLPTLFERHFLPDQASAISADYATQFRRAISIFGSMLDREPLTSDFTTDNLASFCELLALAGYRQRHASKLHCRLRTLWRYAARLQLLEFVPAAKLMVCRRPELPPQAHTLREFVENTYLPQRLIGGATKSIGDVRSAMRRLAEHFGRDIRFDELTDKLIADHFAWLLTSGRCAFTVNNHRLRIFAVWRRAYQHGLIDRLPSVPALRLDRDPPDAWTQTEAQAIIKAARQFRPGFFISGISAGDYWQALLLIAWWTALRKRSLFSIRVRDLNFETATLFIPGKNMKTGKGKRYKLAPDAVAAVQRILLPERELLFPCPFNPVTMSQHFAAILQDSGVPAPSRSLSMFHKWRRTVATHLARTAGLAAACALLGHSAEYVTRLYVDESQLLDNDITAILPSLTIEPPPLEHPGAKHTKLTEAAELLRKGHHTAAAALARVALEQLLHHACQISGGIPRGGAINKMTLARTLQRRGWIDEEGFLSIRDLSDTGNAAAHGRRVSPNQVQELITGVDCLYHSKLSAGEFQP